MEPRIKADNMPTYHRDGTVSYWSSYRQLWVREDAATIEDRELAAMDPSERAKTMRHAEIPKRCR